MTAIALLVSLGALALWASIAALELVARDGLRPIPFDANHERR